MNARIIKTIILYQTRDDKWRWQVYFGNSDIPAKDSGEEFNTAEAACASATTWIEQR